MSGTTPHWSCSSTSPLRLFVHGSDVVSVNCGSRRNLAKHQMLHRVCAWMRSMTLAADPIGVRVEFAAMPASTLATTRRWPWWQGLERDGRCHPG